MKARTSIALAIAAGIASGAATFGVLYAQAKPPVYTVVEVTVKDADAYAKQYAPKARALIEAKGGKFIAISNNVTAIEGKAPPRLVIHQWQSMEQVKAWHGSKEYAENRKIGNKYASFRILAVEGMPQP